MQDPVEDRDEEEEQQEEQQPPQQQQQEQQEGEEGSTGPEITIVGQPVPQSRGTSPLALRRPWTMVLPSSSPRLHTCTRRATVWQAQMSLTRARHAAKGAVDASNQVRLFVAHPCCILHPPHHALRRGANTTCR